MAKQKIKICVSCNQLFKGRLDARTCSERCRKRLQRAKQLVEQEASAVKSVTQNIFHELEDKLTPFATEEGFVGQTIETPVATSQPPTSVAPASTLAPQPAASPAKSTLQPAYSPVPTQPQDISGLQALAQPAMPPSAFVAQAPIPVAEAPRLAVEAIPLVAQPRVIKSNAASAPIDNQVITSPAPRAPEPIVEAQPVKPLEDSLEYPSPQLFVPDSRSISPVSRIGNPTISPSPISAPSILPLNSPSGPGEPPKPSSILSPEPPKPPKNRIPKIGFPSWARMAVASTLIVSVVAIGTYLLGNQSAQNKISSQSNPTTVAGQDVLPSGSDVESLHFNKAVTIDRGASLTATGTATFKNLTDSTSALNVQNASGDNILVVDTQNRRVGINIAPTGAQALQVGGDINISGKYLINGLAISSGSLTNDANLAKLGATQTFSGVNTLTNSANTIAGNGSGLTSLNASNISSGTLNDSMLSTNVALLGATQTFSGVNTLTNSANTIAGNGSGLTSLNASSLSSGTVSDSRLSGNVALLNANQSFTGNNTFTGSVLAKDTTNSTTALQIQNSSGLSLFTADTTGYGGITINSLDSGYNDEFNSGGPTAASKWIFSAPGANGSYDVNSTTSGKLHFTASAGNHDCYPPDTKCLTLLETPPTGDFLAEIKIDTTPTNLQAVGITVKQADDTYLRFEYEYTAGDFSYHFFAHKVIFGVGTPDVFDCVATAAPVWLRVTRVGNVWTLLHSIDGTTFSACGSMTQNYDLTLPTAGIGPSYNGGAASGAYSGDVDYFRVSIPSTGTFKSTISSNIFQNGADSTSAFNIQNTSGVSLFNADTTNTRIAIGQASANYTLDVNGDINITSGSNFKINGTDICTASGCTAAAGSGNYIQNGTSVQSANFNIQTTSAGSVVATIKGAIGQTADLLQIKNSSDINVFTVGPDGRVLVQTTGSDTTNAFRILNHDGTSNLFVANTADARIAIAQAGANYTLDVGGDINSTTGIRVGGNLVCDTVSCNPAPGSGNYIQNSTAVQTGNFAIQSDLNTHVVAKFRGASGQSADLIQGISGDGGSTVLAVGAAGDTVFRNAATFDSATAFRIQKADATTNLFVVDSASSRIAIGPSAVPANGVLTVGTNTTTAAGGIYFGTGVNLYQGTGSTLRTDNNLYALGPNGVSTFSLSGNESFRNFLLSSDSQPAIKINGDGKINWGPGGSTSVDTNLYRATNDSLKTDDAFTVVGLTTLSGGLAVNGARDGGVSSQLNGSLASGPALRVKSSSATNNGSIFNVMTNGGNSLLTVAATGGAGSSGLVCIGNNCSTQAGGLEGGLYITDAATAPTSNPTSGSVIFSSPSGYTLPISSLAFRSGSSTIAVDTSGDKLLFGSAGDTNLFRNSAANRLKTSGNFEIGLDARVTGDVFAGYGLANQIRLALSSPKIVVGSMSDGATSEAVLGNTIGTGGTPGVSFGVTGLSQDTTLYRSAANVLRTTGTIVAATALQAPSLDTIGSGNLVIAGVNATRADICKSTTCATLNLGANDNALNVVTIESGTAANAIQIGNSSSNHGIQIGSNATGVQTVVLGSTSSTSATTIQAGTGNLNLTTNSASASIIAKSSTNSTTAFQIQDSNSGQLLKADTTNMNITINGANDGRLAAWSTNSTTLPAGLDYGSSVTANGYVYYMGGTTTGGFGFAVSTVYYAKLNSNGSVGSWTTSSNPLPAARAALSSVTYNGYIYAIGGYSGGGQSTVYYAKLNSDGSVGSWVTNGNPLPAARYYQSSVAANGYVYVIGGNSGGGFQSTVYYAKLNSDGSVGSWVTNGNALPAAVGETGATVANGHVYIIGGNNGSVVSTVYYSSINSDGSLAAWSTNANALPVALDDITATVANGYIYAVGGYDGATSKSTVYYASLGSTGAAGSWTTSTNSLPSVLSAHSTVGSNGYIYTIGGTTGSVTSNIYYTSTSRTSIAGSLDLVGITSQTLSDPGSGGSLTAGNTQVVGTLQVKDQANFAQSLNVGGNLNTSGSVSQSSTGATYIGGVDVSGSLTGTGSNNLNGVYVSGRYEYVTNVAGNATACSQSAGSAIGCELQIYDVSNPSTPTYVGGADASGSTNSGTTNSGLYGVHVSGHYAYVLAVANATACSQSAGSAVGCELQVYDISNPSAPTYVGGADASGSTNSGTGTMNAKSIYVSGRYAYIASGSDATACSQSAGSAVGCEFKVFDVSNPAAPTYVGGADASGSANSGTGSNDFYWVSISGRYAYLASGGNATACSQSAGSAIGCELQIYDVSNPSTPTYVGGADASGSTNSGTAATTSKSVFVAGRYAYLASNANATACSQSAGSAVGCEFKVFDVSNPAAPTYVGGADASGSANSGTAAVSDVLSIAVSGRYAYLTVTGNVTACSQSAGSAIGCELQIYDVSNPASPTYVGGTDASGTSNGGTDNITINSVYLSGRYVYTASNSSATACSQSPGSAIGCENRVFDTSGVEAIYLNASSLEGGSLQVQGNASIVNQLNVGGGLSIGQSAEIQGDISGNGKLKLQNSANSTTAFQILNAAGTGILTVDTSTGGGVITLGSASATPVLLVLGNKNTSGDPTCTDGAIYYNSNTKQLRGCANSASNAPWVNLGGSTVATALPTNPYDGETIKLRIGTTPYDFVNLVYDATYGKWVSDQTAVLDGIQGSQTGSPADTATTFSVFWKPYINAGLIPQIRMVGETTHNATSTSSELGWHAYNISDYDYAASVPDDLTEVQTPRYEQRAQTTASKWVGYNMDWSTVTQPGSPKDILIVHLYVGASAGGTLTYRATAWLRWVSQ